MPASAEDSSLGDAVNSVGSRTSVPEEPTVVNGLYSCDYKFDANVCEFLRSFDRVLERRSLWD